MKILMVEIFNKTFIIVNWIKKYLTSLNTMVMLSNIDNHYTNIGIWSSVNQSYVSMLIQMFNYTGKCIPIYEIFSPITGFLIADTLNTKCSGPICIWYD